MGGRWVGGRRWEVRGGSTARSHLRPPTSYSFSMSSARRRELANRGGERPHARRVGRAAGVPVDALRELRQRRLPRRPGELLGAIELLADRRRAIARQAVAAAQLVEVGA